MKGYVVSEIDVTDREVYAEYVSQVPATVEKYGGRFLVRGGKAEALEGAAPRRVVVLEFPSYEQAAQWYRSPEYTRLAALRRTASTGRIVLVEGA
jgi:uncharacterized protein (DUF1330 family)